MNYYQRIKKIFSGLERIDRTINDIVVRQCYNNLFLTNNKCGIEKKVYPEGEIIITLTSYGNKLPQVYLTIESLLNQTIKPNRIILWLDMNRYSDRNNIPVSLQEQESRGLEIRLCEDVRSYTKLVHAIETFPESILISVDDDMLYPIDFVERLYKAYQRNPKNVYFYRGHYMLFNPDGTPKSYNDWVSHGARGCDIFNIPTGVSGILYPPKCYHEDILNKDLFLKLCPHADDVWFKVMTYLKGTVCEKVETFNYDKLFIPLDVDVRSSLQQLNVVNGENDEQIRRVFNYYNISVKK